MGVNIIIPLGSIIIIVFTLLLLLLMYILFGIIAENGLLDKLRESARTFATIFYGLSLMLFLIIFFYIDTLTVLHIINSGGSDGITYVASIRDLLVFLREYMAIASIVIREVSREPIMLIAYTSYCLLVAWYAFDYVAFLRGVYRDIIFPVPIIRKTNFCGLLKYHEERKMDVDPHRLYKSFLGRARKSMIYKLIKMSLLFALPLSALFLFSILSFQQVLSILFSVIVAAWASYSEAEGFLAKHSHCLLYTSPSPRDRG